MPPFILLLFFNKCVPRNTICFSPVLNESTDISCPYFLNKILFSSAEELSILENDKFSKKLLKEFLKRDNFAVCKNSSSDLGVLDLLISIQSELSCVSISTINCLIEVKFSLESFSYLFESNCDVVTDFTLSVVKPERAFE